MTKLKQIYLSFSLPLFLFPFQMSDFHAGLASLYVKQNTRNVYIHIHIYLYTYVKKHNQARKYNEENEHSYIDYVMNPNMQVVAIKRPIFCNSASAVNSSFRSTSALFPDRPKEGIKTLYWAYLSCPVFFVAAFST